MKPKRIVFTPPYSWVRRVTLLVGILSAFYLFIEPLSTFGLGESLFKTAGIWGYGTLILASVAITLGKEYWDRRHFIGKLVFTNLVILITENGTEHFVEVPRSMRVGQFIGLFLSEISIRALVPIMDMYLLNLLVKRNGQYQVVPNSETIFDAGLQDGDVCMIRGNIYSRFQTITLSTRRPLPWEEFVQKIEANKKLILSFGSWLAKFLRQQSQ